MSNNLTAQLDRINIPIEQKIEVVSTLVAYPILLEELTVTEQLVESCNKIVSLQETQLKTKDNQINLLKSQISNLEQQKKLFDTQLRKSKNNQLKLIGIGLATVVTTILIK